MHFQDQPIIPAVRHMKDFEEVMTRDFRYVVLLESHLAQLPSLVRLAKQHEKKLLLHADLIQGLKHDEAAAQFLCQMVRPAGLISTHSTVIATAKKNRVLGIQRVFLIDSHSLETSYRVLASSKPDYIEVLPGVLPDVIREVKHGTKLPILAGGFIRTPEEIRSILESGATAVTTSHRDLWSFGEHLQHGN
ncbi:glycerol-3-phosphate responsive antiterminator [Alicyclobacillus fastidiosus]|uniref:Glycerol uptake operon antiterminator regulatory protein n=1 Tax=Alicyclobacillus fastidiosus TaxID=392011 RepID=A0ABY6ZCI2_9BACL|nr:glycerol-3-phosphate responsive antiterminator [Alicyclobacillus fastidiosus]WAH39966.1 glycerol-3-phosphate responsive antiterminator [Alicyclobacillus fastidiosus]